MATDVTKIFAATSGGLAYAGPVGTTAPTSAASALNAAFYELGTVSDDGLAEKPNTSTTQIKNWAGVTARTLITDTEFQFTFTLLQTDARSLELYHGGSKVASLNPNGSKMDVSKTTQNKLAFVFDVLDGSNTSRIYVPTGEVTDIGEIKYSAGEAAAYELTVTAYPDANGKALTKFWETDFTLT